MHRHQYECPQCDGFGYLNDDGTVECPRCDGEGIIKYEKDSCRFCSK